MSEIWPWLAIALLGAYHGVNPAMGWLFAVALGLQERRRRAVLRALIPIALGHEASIVVVVLLVGAVSLVADPQILRIVAAAALILAGLYKFARPRSHPKWVGMRVTPPELALWSFLMSTAHGAGLMLVPVVVWLPATGHDHAAHAHDLPRLDAAMASVAQSGAAVMLHTAVMLLVMAVVALLVYEKLGVAILRRAWLNLDIVWAAAIVGAGVLTLFT